MINLYRNVTSLWPAALVLSPRLNTKIPMLCQVYDFDRVSPSSSVGNTRDAIQGSVGEFLERKHFYNEIKINAKVKSLDEMMSSKEVTIFIDAIKQTSCLSENNIKKHKFHTLPVLNINNVSE